MRQYAAKYFLPILLLADVLIVVIAALLFGYRFEDMSDVFFENMFIGNFCQSPLHLFNNYPALFPFSYIFQWLYIINNSVPWYGLIMTALFIIILYTNQYLFYKLSQHYRLSANYLYLFCFLIICLLLPDIIFLQYTKIAIYLANTGALVALYAAITNSKQKRVWVASALLILLAISIRAFVIAVPAFFFLLFTILHYKQLFKVKTFLLLGVFMLLFWGADVYLNTKAYTSDDENYAKIENLKELIFDYSINKNNSIYKSEKDSIKMVAFSNFLISDEANFNTEFYARITNGGNDNKLAITLNEMAKDSSFVKEKLQVIIGRFILIGKINFLAFTSYIVTVIFSILIFYSNAKKTIAKKIIIYNTILLVFILLFSFVAKVEARLLIPLLTISFIYNLILIIVYLPQIKSKPNLNTKLYLSFITILLLLNVIQKLAMSINWGKVSVQKENLYRLLAKENASGTIMVWDALSYSILYPDIYANGRLPANKTNISIDCGYFFLTESYRGYMKKITNANTFKGYALYLSKNKEKVLFISNEIKMQLLVKYLKIVYNIELIPTKVYDKPVVNSVSVVGNNNVFYLYKLN